MIYYLTVHWNNPGWIKIQREFIDRNTSGDHKIFAFLNGFDAEPWTDCFEYVSTENIVQHAIKLNLLADLASMESKSDDDVLIFIDGDAFPVEPVDDLCASVVSGEHRLIAVQRLENAGDPQPHPCFCVTTTGFWKRIAGDWKEGPTWKNANGEDVTDVGGRLLRNLERNGIAWKPLLRSNAVDLHPLWYGVYGNVVYHHGAGFRPAISRLDYVWLRRLAKLLPPPLRSRLRDIFLSATQKSGARKREMPEAGVTIEEIAGNFRFHDRLVSPGGSSRESTVQG